MTTQTDYIAAVSDFAVELVEALTRNDSATGQRIAADVANGGHLKLAFSFEGAEPTVDVSMVMPCGHEHPLARNMAT